MSDSLSSAPRNQRRANSKDASVRHTASHGSGVTWKTVPPPGPADTRARQDHIGPSEVQPLGADVADQDARPNLAGRRTDDPVGIRVVGQVSLAA
jgi:hypothetical protein